MAKIEISQAYYQFAKRDTTAQHQKNGICLSQEIMSVIEEENDLQIAVS